MQEKYVITESDEELTLIASAIIVPDRQPIINLVFIQNGEEIQRVDSLHDESEWFKSLPDKEKWERLVFRIHNHVLKLFMETLLGAAIGAE